MTPQEALNLLNDTEFAEKHQGKEEYTDMLLMCKAALEKQMPKKPILKETKAFDGSTIDFVFVCPVCNRTICIEPEDDVIADYIKEEYSHCHCGQKLSWESDTE